MDESEELPPSETSELSESDIESFKIKAWYCSSVALSDCINGTCNLAPKKYNARFVVCCCGVWLPPKILLTQRQPAKPCLHWQRNKDVASPLQLPLSLLFGALCITQSVFCQSIKHYRVDQSGMALRSVSLELLVVKFLKHQQA